MKNEIESGAKELKEILAEEGAEVSKITGATNNLQTSMQKLGESVYGQSGDNESEQDPSENDPKDEPVEGEYKEV